MIEQSERLHCKENRFYTLNAKMTRILLHESMDGWDLMQIFLRVMNNIDCSELLAR